MKTALSPFYIDTPFVSPASGLTCVSYTLEIYIWKGLNASQPAEPSYSITKTNPTSSTGSDTVNISRLINPFIDFIPQKATSTSLLDSPNQVWGRTKVIYTTTSVEASQLETTHFYIRGYSYGIEGRNYDIALPSILITGNEFKVSKTSYFSLPIYFESGTINIKSYPNLEINRSITKTITSDSNELVQYLIIDINETTNDEYVEVTFNGETITLLITDECKYTPIDMYFINKEGGQQSLTFFKSSVEDMRVSSEEFESDRGQANLGFHQFTRFNVNAKSKFKVNSGFVDEENNEAFKQLLLSGRVWKLDNNVFVPLNLNSKSIEYKSRQKDRLINYELTFDYAYNEINNI